VTDHYQYQVRMREDGRWEVYTTLMGKDQYGLATFKMVREALDFATGKQALEDVEWNAEQAAREGKDADGNERHG